MTLTAAILIAERGDRLKRLLKVDDQELAERAGRAATQANTEAGPYLGTPLPDDEFVRDKLLDVAVFKAVKAGGDRMPDTVSEDNDRAMAALAKIAAGRLTLTSTRSDPEPTGTRQSQGRAAHFTPPDWGGGSWL